MRSAILIISLLFLAACGATTTTSSPDFTAAPSAERQTASSTPSPNTDTSLAPIYELGPGDQVRIIVFGEEDLSGEFFVDGAGYVSVPLIGEVPAAGKTLSGFRAELETLLADGYLTDPRVSAEVLNYRPFYILGEVEDSGEYPYTDGLTVLNAVARAGGFTHRANERRVEIKRADTEEEFEAELTPTLRVMPGDTIRILERFF